MATLTIRRLDDEVHARLRTQARANKRSLEAEVRLILEARTRTPAAIADDLIAFHDEMVERHGLLPDSVADLRAIRDGE